MPGYLDTERRYERRQTLKRCRRYGLFLFAFVLGVGCLLLWKGEIGQGIDRWVLQQFFSLRGKLTPPEDIIIVGRDQGMLEKYGLPLPRAVIADGLEKIVQGDLKLLIVDASLPQDGAEPEADKRIARAFASVPTVIGAGKFYTDEGEALTFGSDSIFQEAASFEIPMTFPGDQGVVSRIAIDRSKEASLYQRVPLAQALPPGSIAADMTPPGQFDLINFYGPAGTVRHISLQDLIDGDLEYAKEQLKDRIVLVGGNFGEKSSKIENSDEFFISASPDTMYGVEIHATIVGNILEQSWIRQLDSIHTVAIFYCCVVFIFLLIFFLHPFLAYMLIGLMLVLLTVLNYLLFSWQLVWSGGLGTVWLVAILSIILTGIYKRYCLKGVQRYLKERFN